VTMLALPHRWSRAEVLTNPLIFAVVMSIRWTRRALRLRAARRRLEEMPDYLLADIGITRCDIDSATRFGRLRRSSPSYRL
jgi:uncharacterized protein YjiS (DUF1127 family)